jgi:hypothetical protein
MNITTVLIVLLGITCGHSFTYDNNIGFKSTLLSAITYCPEDSVKDWNCYWCSNISNFKVIETFWDDFTSTFCYFGSLDNCNYVLAFEGSQDEKDAKLDFNYSKLVPYKHHPTAKVHGGFWTAYTSIRSGIYSLIKNRDCLDSIHVVGHSLGGSLATLASLDLVEELNINGVSMVSIGAPRVGNNEYAKLYDSRVEEYYRLTHARDPIVHLPYRLMGFTHIGHEIYYPDNTLEYIQCVEGENPRCSNSVARDSLNFTDHGYYMDIRVARCGS